MVEYAYTGLSRLISRTSAAGTGLRGNDTTTTVDTGTAGQYAGLDFAGRPIEMTTHDIGTPTAEQSSYESRKTRYGADKFSQPQNDSVRGRSQLITRDNLRRITEIDYGQLDSARTDILSEWSDPTQAIFTRNVVGRITSLDRKNSGTSAVAMGAAVGMRWHALAGRRVRIIARSFENCRDGPVPGSDDIDGNGTADATGHSVRQQLRALLLRRLARENATTTAPRAACWPSRSTAPSTSMSRRVVIAIWRFPPTVRRRQTTASTALAGRAFPCHRQYVDSDNDGEFSDETARTGKRGVWVRNTPSASFRISRDGACATLSGRAGGYRSIDSLLESLPIAK